MEILFVCTGNTCRSPMAETIFNSICPAGMVAFSRGTSVRNSLEASGNAVAAMGKMGLSLDNFIPGQWKKEDIDKAHMVLCMTGDHKNSILREYPYAKEKLYTIYEFAQGADKDVNDPYNGSLNDYEECALELNRLIISVLRKIVR